MKLKKRGRGRKGGKSISNSKTLCFPLLRYQHMRTAREEGFNGCCWHQKQRRRRKEEEEEWGSINHSQPASFSLLLPLYPNFNLCLLSRLAFFSLSLQHQTCPKRGGNRAAPNEGGRMSKQTQHLWERGHPFVVPLPLPAFVGFGGGGGEREGRKGEKSGNCPRGKIVFSFLRNILRFPNFSKL